MSEKFELYGFWRSIATYRVRIALALKGLEWEEHSVDLIKGEQYADSLVKLSSQASVPIILMEAGHLTQSLAILEYLEEVYPDPPLLPRDPMERAQIRSFALITIADTHPLLVPRVRKYLAENFNADEGDITRWGQNWTGLALEGMEKRLSGRVEKTSYCFGNQPGLADIALTAQVSAASLFEYPLDKVPLVSEIYGECLKLEAFSRHSPKEMLAKLESGN
jgi:maleylacetoacetate isomerase